MGRIVKRWLIALGILVAAAPFWVALWIAFDEGGKLIDEPEPPPPAAPPKPRRRVEVPVAKTPAELLLDASKHNPPAPPSPARLGVLELHVIPKKVDGGAIRLTALLPTGERLGTLTPDGKGFSRFESLPHDVPLVVRVEAPGHLTGYCCDVLLEPGRVARKLIELAPSPVVRIRVVESPKGSRVNGARVELWRGAEVVGSGTTDSKGAVSMTLPVVGVFRVHVEADGLAASTDTTIDVWPAENPIEREVGLIAGGSVEVAVLSASGTPAPGVDVWLVGEANTPPLVRTDERGIAVFPRMRPGLKLKAIARASDGSVASAEVTTESGPPQRVPVLLGKPGPLVGDVVDVGGGAIAGAEVEVRIRPLSEPVTVTSDATGRFETPPLPSGLAEVTVRVEGFADWHSPGVVVIDPATGGKVRARLSRPPVGTAFVTVKNDSGRPLADALVKLYPSRRSERTDKDGTCRFDGLPAGVEQSVFVRCRGHRARAATDGDVILPRADVAASAEIVMSPVADPPAEPGPCSIKGVLQWPDRRPLQGALVEAGPWCTATAADGSFLLEGVKPTKPGEPVEFRVSMVPWPLERIRFLVDVEASGVLDFGTVLLRTQPYAEIRLDGWRDTGRQTRSIAFWLSTNHEDTFLGRTTGRFEPVACVSYDGTWLHLPPPDDWRRDGRGVVFLAHPTARGLVTCVDGWTLRPNAAAQLRPMAHSEPGDLDVSAVMADRTKEPITFRQLTCDTMFDPRSIHVPTGDDQPLIDPFASLVGFRTFTLDKVTTKARIEDMAPGRWRVHCGRDLSGEVNVPEESRVRLGK